MRTTYGVGLRPPRQSSSPCGCRIKVWAVPRSPRVALMHSYCPMITFLRRRRSGSFMNSFAIYWFHSLLYSVEVLYSCLNMIPVFLVASYACHPLLLTTIMSQLSPKPTADPLLPLSRPESNDRNHDNSGDQEISGSLQNTRPTGRVLDDLPNFTYDPDEQSRDPLDSWPGKVEMRPRRRSTLLSSLFRGNQPHRSFFGDNVKDDEAGPGAVEKRQASKPFDNARRLSKTAVSAMKDKVPLPGVPWKQKRSLSQSANSRARAHIFILSSLYLAHLTNSPSSFYSGS